MVQRIFLDDLEIALRTFAKDAYLDVMDPKNPEVFDSLLKAYYAEGIQLKVNDKLQSINYLGHKREKAHMYSYMETEKKIKKTAEATFYTQYLTL